MKDIRYCKSQSEWSRVSNDLDYPVHIPINAIIIDWQGSIYEDLSKLPIVSRLEEVHQLGLADQCVGSINAYGTRYSHSLICATKIDYLSQKHGFGRNLGVFAGILHDVATPPRSDSSAVGLCISDEGWFGYVIDQCPRMKELLDKYSVSRAELINAVRGKSKDPITQLVNRPGSLDVDRWSYTICDAQTLGVFPGRFAGNYVNDPFKNIALYDGEIVFLDLDSVANCLELRVNMFEKFYKSPELRAKEAFSGKVAKELLDRGVITRESIFKIGDIDFDKLVREYGGELGKRLYSLDGFDSYGPVNASEKELENFLGQITDHPFVVKRHKAFDAGIETPVMIDGTIKTYKEWNYRHAIQLKHRMSEWSHNTHVYGYENDSVLKDAVDKALREFGIDLSARLEYFMDWEHLDSD